MNLDADRLVSSGLFDFNEYTYHVHQEKAKNNFWGSLVRLEQESTRYWISRVSKKPSKRNQDLYILCLFFSWETEKWEPDFCLPRHLNKHYKIFYWYDQQTPIDILQRVRAKSDVESLYQSSIISSDDL